MIKKIINLIIKLLNNNNELFYVGNLDNLPAPLSKEEEILYVKKAEEGDSGAKEKLIEHNLRLVVFLAKKLWKYKYRLRRLSKYWNNRTNKRSKYI